MTYKFWELRAAEMCGVPVQKLFTKTRERDVVLARQLCMLFADTIPGMSQAKNAGRFDKDHALVVSTKITISNQCETDKDLSEFVNKYMYICRAELDAERNRETGVAVIKERGMTAFIQEQNSAMINCIHSLNQFLSGDLDDDKVMESVELVEAAIGKIKFNFSK